MSVDQNAPGQTWEESFIDLDDLELPDIELENLDAIAGGTSGPNCASKLTATMTCGDKCGFKY